MTPVVITQDAPPTPTQIAPEPEVPPAGEQPPPAPDDVPSPWPEPVGWVCNPLERTYYVPDNNMRVRAGPGVDQPEAWDTLLYAGMIFPQVDLGMELLQCLDMQDRGEEWFCQYALAEASASALECVAHIAVVDGALREFPGRLYVR
jgi:hypothetical protein